MQWSENAYPCVHPNVHEQFDKKVCQEWIDKAVAENRLTIVTDTELQSLCRPFFRSVLEHHIAKQGRSIILFDICHSQSLMWIQHYFINARVKGIVCIVRCPYRLPPNMRQNLDMCIFRNSRTHHEYAILYEKLRTRCPALLNLIPPTHSLYFSPEDDKWNEQVNYFFNTETETKANSHAIDDTQTI